MKFVRKWHSNSLRLRIATRKYHKAFQVIVLENEQVAQGIQSHCEWGLFQKKNVGGGHTHLFAKIEIGDDPTHPKIHHQPPQFKLFYSTPFKL